LLFLIYSISDLLYRIVILSEAKDLCNLPAAPQMQAIA
jgi:hypothetical protein